ncbi:MAG: hypothetical protein EOM24_29145, partial [Chloroflexia bacterium]|nr:hypothetical protein [Chloroflexia bacterium]
MPLKAITFLGNPPKTKERPFGYDQKCYQATDGSGATCESPFVARAICQFYQPDELYVLSTAESFASHWTNLVTHLEDQIVPVPIEIPTPTNDEQIWQFFQKITALIQADDDLIFDVTLAFRSIPILALLAANLLRVVRGTTVRALTYAEVNYGVYEAPIHDLRSLVQLMDWTTATDAFLKYGRADDLIALARHDANDALTRLADSLQTLTIGLQTSRPTEVQVTAATLEAHLQAVRANPATPAPIGLLLDRISAEYTPLGHEVPTEPSQAEEVLRGQAAIIAWYVTKGMYVQAITLAREWLVSWVVARAQGNLFAEEERTLAESAINKPHKPTTRLYDRQQRKEREVAVPLAMRTSAQHALVASLWKRTRDLRNDLGHTGMRINPRLA